MEGDALMFRVLIGVTCVPNPVYCTN